MLSIEPWNAQLTAGDFKDWLVSVDRPTLDSVRYIVPQGERWPAGHSERIVHEVDMAVQLLFQDGASVLFRWAMRGRDEGIGFEQRALMERDDSLDGSAIDVSLNEDWFALIRESILEITPIWHIPNEGSVIMPCAFQIAFSGQSQVIVALGERDGNESIYSPDDLLVFFDLKEATSYLSSLSSIGK